MVVSLQCGGAKKIKRRSSGSMGNDHTDKIDPLSEFRSANRGELETQSSVDSLTGKPDALVP